MLIKNTLWSVAGGGVSALAALVSIPVLIALLGYDLFAIVSLLISLTIFFFVFDLGMSRTMTFLVPNVAEGSLESEGLIGSALMLSLLVGALVSLLVYFCSPYVTQHWLNIGSSFREPAVLAFQIAAWGILPTVASHVFKGVLEGRQEFKQANICKMFAGSTIFLAPLLVVTLGYHSLVGISAAIVLTRYLALFLYVLLTTGVNISALTKVNSAYVKDVWTYGKWAAVSGFISTMFVYGDRFVVAGYLAAEELSVYIASQDILIRYLLIPWSMAVVLMPVFATKSASDLDTVRLYRQQQRRITALSLAVLSLVLLTAIFLVQRVDLVTLPTGTLSVVSIQTAGIFFCAAAQLPLIYLYAKGRPRQITFIYGVEMLAYVLIAPFVFRTFGLMGACVIWTGRLIVEFLLLRGFAERLIK